MKLAGKKLLAVVESSDSSQKTGQTQKQKQFHSTLQDMLEVQHRLHAHTIQVLYQLSFVDVQVLVLACALVLSELLAPVSAE